MKRIKLLSLILLMLVASCLPVIGTNNKMSITATRSGDTITAILKLTEDAQQVNVLFDGATFQQRFTAPSLAAGEYTYEVTTSEPVACLASANINGRLFEVFC